VKERMAKQPGAVTEPAVSTKLPDISTVKMDYFELAKRLGQEQKRRVTDVSAAEFLADRDREFVQRVTEMLSAEKPKDACRLRCGDPRQHLAGECDVVRY